eukprot:c19351_g1_i1 orf=421-2571(-)
MTKVKLKGAFLSKPVERARPAAEEYDDDNEQEDEEEVFAGRGNSMPFVRADNKRKRGPRGAGRYTQRDSSGLQSSDSALGTSSSRGSDDDDGDEIGDSAQNHGERHGSDDYGFAENEALDSARRGSVRLKVKPSKFRENPSQTHATTEGRSPIKKRTAGTPFESTSSKQPFSARDYTLVDRQQHHLTNELNTALMVVKKIMKMEAAEPFNIPVDPVALGIPDYFDIVKRPMDLGTICKNLERGGKYRGSRDVYEDVQLVWTNCRIYNQKGDPILELLARVKKNFMKYWTAAGLYTEKSPATFKFQSRSPEIEFGGPSHRQREMQEDVDFGRSKKMTKFVREAESPTNSIAKLSSIEQGMFENKGAKLHPAEFVSGFHREQEVASNGRNDELDSYYSNREGPKVISVYKTHKKKKLEQQGKEHSIEAGPKVYEQEQKLGGRGLIAVKHSHTDKSNRQKEADSYAPPGKSRRVSGTGHHKADCSCVVCTGVRRKLAREGKLAAETPVAGPERILVKLKTEGSVDRHKSVTGAGSTKEGRENLKTKEIAGERAYSVPLKKVKSDDSDMISMEAESQKGAERDGASNAEDKEDTVKEETVSEKSKANSETEVKLELAKAISEEGVEEIEDKEGAIQNDEQSADMMDAETERQEGGVQYYRASYEMPLRKVNPSILEISQRLFGSGSPWTRGRSLSRHLSKGCIENPIHSTVSALLSTKGT